ncbi:MAG: 2,3-bisphosphoglycerate-independent phosphoglycerate mutase [Planctomycetes bacterium]|nr:2,3-bisphosphoglycerate-independent phosphoglycerate mutase [Planctomycetota bacterium]
MSQSLHTPVVVIVRDGWGTNPHPEHDKFNAVKLANTPRCDQLRERYPWTLIHTSGEDVGLPEGTMGNSEVGHQNIGAGRIVDQESVRITKAIRTGEFFDNKPAREAVERAKKAGKTVHLMGLASDAGVHALMDHLYGCLALCKKVGHEKVVIHAFTDGRDTGPYTGKGFIERIDAECKRQGVGCIVSICGRYYAMDRDNRWERVKRAYDMLTGRNDKLPTFDSPAAAMQDYYDHPTNNSQQGDEFITPRVVGSDVAATRISDGDSVIFYNYRGDRPREITRAFVMPEFYGQVKPSPDSGEKGFDRGPKLDLFYVTMTAYEEALGQWVHVAFPKPPKMSDIGGEWIAKHNLKQFRCAETEKFPHVTFFFNDYRDEPFAGEDRVIVQSPKVATYDLQPEMSAAGVRDAVLEALDRDYALIIVNFANGDMVGHTGKLDAAIKAVQTVDQCVGAITDKTLAKGGSLIITADHGNAEQMFDPQTNAPHTAHTTYDVECILVSPKLAGSRVELTKGGRLADIIPTAFKLMGLPQPPAMTGQSLLP